MTLFYILSDVLIATVCATDLVLMLVHRLFVRMQRGKVRRWLIRNYGPTGPGLARIGAITCFILPSIVLTIFGQITLGVSLGDLYWIILGTVNLIDYITSWDDPPWRKALRWASERAQKLLERMGERSKAPGIPVPIPR